MMTTTKRMTRSRRRRADRSRCCASARRRTRRHSTCGYNRALGEEISRDPIEEWGGGLYVCLYNQMVSDVDYLGLQSFARKESEQEKEQRLWLPHAWEAEWPIEFWISFLDCRLGKGSSAPTIPPECKSKLLCILRAVSWVESKHGTVGQNEPSKDPIQTGNPLDKWWQELVGLSGQGSRFIGGPNAGNYWANELSRAVQDFYNKQSMSCVCDLRQLQNPASGHNDPNFHSGLSYFWGSVYLIQKISGSPFYDFGRECPSKQEMIDGAVRYNGGGDPDYRAKITQALDLIGCMK